MFTRWEASGIFSGKGTIDIFGENVDCVPIPSLPPTKTRGVSFIFTAVSLYKMYNLSICFEAMRKLVEGSDTHVAGEGYSCSVLSARPADEQLVLRRLYALVFGVFRNTLAPSTTGCSNPLSGFAM